MVQERPGRDEAPAYYFTYIDKVGDGPICDILAAQHGEAAALFRGLSDTQSLARYAPDKWSIREVVAHLNDTERMLTFRAMWFARRLEGGLPSFDQDVASRHAGADEASWDSHVDELLAIRTATVHLFRHVPADAWDRRGMASGHTFTVRALCYVVAGHYIHHAAIVKDRYLQAA
jgi:hypothetical protein